MWGYVERWVQYFRGHFENTIDKMQVESAIRALGYNLQPSTLNLLMTMFEKKKGRWRGEEMTLENFIQLCVTLQTLTNSFCQKDLQKIGQINMNYDQFLSAVIALR